MQQAVSLIKQPEPNVSATVNAPIKSENAPQEVEKPKRAIKRPHVGAIDVPYISKTPITDTLEIKKEENPHIKYKINPKPKGKFSIKEISSLGIIGCGIACLLGLKKK